MSEKLHEIATIPNILTVARLAVSPYFAKRMHDDPRGWTWRSAALMMSDILDGTLARLGDNHEGLSKAGFRRSETGRKLDPFVDKIVGSEMIFAGVANGVIPKKLGVVALTQKIAISAFVAKKTAEGREIHVTQLGKHTETGINLGFGSFLLAESIDDPRRKSYARIGAGVITAVSLVGAIAANADYVMQTMRYPEHEIVPLPTETVSEV